VDARGELVCCQDRVAPNESAECHNRLVRRQHQWRREAGVGRREQVRRLTTIRRHVYRHHRHDQRGDQPGVYAERASNERVDQSDREYAGDCLRQEDAQTAEPEQTRAERLDPETEWWLVDRGSTPGP
jgi:hypothetical protein